MQRACSGIEDSTTAGLGERVWGKATDEQLGCSKIKLKKRSGLQGVFKVFTLVFYSLIALWKTGIKFGVVEYFESELNSLQNNLLIDDFGQLREKLLKKNCLQENDKSILLKHHYSQE